MSHFPSVRDDSYPVECILIVEDDVVLGALLQEAIQDEVTMPVLLASSGERALPLLQTHKPALCLLDYHLPGMSGLEITHYLRRQEGYEHLSIVLMSANLPQENLAETHIRTLKKPFDLDELLQLITILLVSEEP